MVTPIQGATHAPLGEVNPLGVQNQSRETRASHREANKENPTQAAADLSSSHKAVSSGKKAYVHCQTPRGGPDENYNPSVTHQ